MLACWHLGATLAYTVSGSQSKHPGRLAPSVIAVEVRDLAIGGGDSSRIEDVVRPTLPRRIVGGKGVKLKTVAAKASYDFVVTIAVQVTNRKGLAVEQAMLEDRCRAIKFRSRVAECVRDDPA